MSRLRLRLRTPTGLLVDREVESIRAEDLDGWFGIRPLREDVVAVMPPSVLSFVDDEGEAFAAVAGGLLDLDGDECRVMAREAVLSRRLEDVCERVRELEEAHRRQERTQRDVVQDLVREVLRRLVEEGRAAGP